MRPDAEDWLRLAQVPGLGPARVLRLVEHCGAPGTALAAGAREWRAAGVPEGLHPGAAPAPPPAALRWLEQPRRHLLTWLDDAYPPLLREIPAPPPLLFVHGDVALLGKLQIAVVGARSATAQGREDARAFAAALAAAGLVVTSGLALGIDAAAHRGALQGGGATLAICGNGLDRVYPARHRELAHAIAADGALVSEFLPGTAPRPEHFPRRNRIISGLALGVLVVEAARASGSLITARLAAEQGREVFAMPGSIHNPLARGCHALIRDGAKLVEEIGDLLEELGLAAMAPPAATGAGAAPPEDALQARILDVIGVGGALGLDDLAARLSAPVPELAEALLALELAGRLQAGPGERYQRVDPR